MTVIGFVAEALVPLAAGQNDALMADLEALRAEVLAQRVLIQARKHGFNRSSQFLGPSLFRSSSSATIPWSRLEGFRR